MAFNKEQKLVIDELEKNILLLASAGTGKTNTLAARISNIIKSNKAKAEEVLCITFTNKACAEMRERIEKIVGESAKDITIRTFHSFCFDLIKSEAKKKTDIFSNSIVFDEEDCKEIIKECNFYNYPVNKLQNFIDIVKVEKAKLNLFGDDLLKSYNEAINHIFKFKHERVKQLCTYKGKFDFQMEEDLKKYGGRLVVLYNSLLYSNHGLDFADLTTKAKELLLDEELVLRLKTRFKYINIDEVQDTSMSDYEIIEKIFKGDKSKNILLCGDIFQTIYKWRGSEPDKIFEAFKKECNPLEIVFDKNYRSTQTLTNASIDFLGNVFESRVSEIYKDGVSSCSDETGEKISVISYDNLEAEAIGILNSFKNLALEGEDLSKVCVLTRANNYNKDLSKVLSRISENQDFEFILVDEYKFFRRAEIKDITAIFKILINPYDTVSLERVLKRLNTGVGKAILEKMETTEFRKARIKLSDFISDYTANGEFYTNLLNAYDRASSDGNIVIFDVESTGTDVTSDEIIQIAAVKIDNKGNIIDTYERFIKPNKTVGASAKVHHFTDEYLAEHGLPKEEVLNEFREYTKDKILIGHNVQYDINIFTSELNRCNIGAPLFKGFYDTLDIYRRFYPMEKNHKLEYLSERFKTTHKPSHDALDDIIATTELLVMAIEAKIRPTSFQRMSLIADLYKKFEEFREKYRVLKQKSYEIRPYEMILEIQKNFDIMNKYIVQEREERFRRVMNFHKILSVLDDNEKCPRDALISAVEVTALSGGEIEQIVSSTQEKPRIPIITVHQAKGLEYNTVIVSGLIDGKFPLYNGDLDEEGKLFYVAITRAKKRLILTYPNKNMSNYGKEYDTVVSPFIGKIDEKYLEFK